MKTIQKLIERADSAFERSLYWGAERISALVVKARLRKYVSLTFVGGLVFVWLASEQFWDSAHFHSKELTPAENAGVRDEDFRGAFLWVFGALWCFIGGTKSWIEINRLEQDWRIKIQDERFVSQFLKDVQVNPHNYREDFREWVEHYHPELAIWKRPPHSRN